MSLLSDLNKATNEQQLTRYGFILQKNRQWIATGNYTRALRIVGQLDEHLETFG